jgi:hypothetical protein
LDPGQPCQAEAGGPELYAAYPPTHQDRQTCQWRADDKLARERGLDKRRMAMILKGLHRRQGFEMYP